MRNVKILDRHPMDYEKIIVASDAISQLNATKRAAATAVFLTVEDASIRYRIDGGSPDSSNGHLVVASAYQGLSLSNRSALENLRMIAISSSAVVIVTYYL